MNHRKRLPAKRLGNIRVVFRAGAIEVYFKNSLKFTSMTTFPLGSEGFNFFASHINPIVYIIN